MPNDQEPEPYQPPAEPLLTLTQEEIERGWWDLLAKILERAEARRKRTEAKFSMKGESVES